MDIVKYCSSKGGDRTTRPAETQRGGHVCVCLCVCVKRFRRAGEWTPSKISNEAIEGGFVESGAPQRGGGGG